jgi:hypothetical protein
MVSGSLPSSRHVAMANGKRFLQVRAGSSRTRLNEIVLHALHTPLQDGG